MLRERERERGREHGRMHWAIYLPEPSFPRNISYLGVSSRGFVASGARPSHCHWCSEHGRSCWRHPPYHLLAARGGTVGSSADLVHAGGLQVKEHSAGHVLAGSGLREEGVERIILNPMVLSEGMNPSGWMPCSRQYNFQQALPTWILARPRWMEMTSRMVRGNTSLSHPRDTAEIPRGGKYKRNWESGNRGGTDATALGYLPTRTFVPREHQFCR